MGQLRQPARKAAPTPAWFPGAQRCSSVQLPRSADSQLQTTLTLCPPLWFLHLALFDSRFSPSIFFKHLSVIIHIFLKCCISFAFPYYNLTSMRTEVWLYTQVSLGPGPVPGKHRILLTNEGDELPEIECPAICSPRIKPIVLLSFLICYA